MSAVTSAEYSLLCWSDENFWHVMVMSWTWQKEIFVRPILHHGGWHTVLNEIVKYSCWTWPPIVMDNPGLINPDNHYWTPMANCYLLCTWLTTVVTHRRVPHVFRDNSAATVPHVVSPNVSNCEPNDESAGQVMCNLVIHLDSHANNERGTTTDVHSDWEWHGWYIYNKGSFE